jgi:hypothetical protein
MATYYWGLGKPDVPLRPSLTPIAALGFVFVSEIATAIAHSAERTARVLFGFENYALDRAAFHQQAARELEAMTDGHYWEVDTEEGVYVASLDEVEIDDDFEDDDEDED